jgi:hypothetical protein
MVVSGTLVLAVIEVLAVIVVSGMIEVVACI